MVASSAFEWPNAVSEIVLRRLLLAPRGDLHLKNMARDLLAVGVAHLQKADHAARRWLVAVGDDLAVTDNADLLRQQSQFQRQRGPDRQFGIGQKTQSAFAERNSLRAHIGATGVEREHGAGQQLDLAIDGAQVTAQLAVLFCECAQYVMILAVDIAQFAQQPE